MSTIIPNNEPSFALLLESAKSIFDLHAGRPGAADDFLVKHRIGPGMQSYFVLIGALPKTTWGPVRINWKREIETVFGAEAGALLISEISGHPIVPRPQIASFFIAKKDAVLEMIYAEADPFRGAGAPSNAPAASRPAQNVPAVSIPALYGLASVQAAFAAKINRQHT